MTDRIKPVYKDIRDFHHDVYSPENSEMLRDQYRQAQQEFITSHWDAIMRIEREQITRR